MATYGGGYVIDAAIAANGSSGTLYTAPAAKFAIINVSLSTSAATNVAVTVGGQDVLNIVSQGTLSYNSQSWTSNERGDLGGTGPSIPVTAQGIYVGPGQSVVVSGSNAFAKISGVQFSNPSP